MPSMYSRPSNNRRMLRRQQTASNATATNQFNSSNSTIINQTNALNSTIVNQAKTNSNRPPGCFMCIIEDNSPLVHYDGVWVLSGTQFSTTHSTTVSNSSVSLRFNGRSSRSSDGWNYSTIMNQEAGLFYSEQYPRVTRLLNHPQPYISSIIFRHSKQPFPVPPKPYPTSHSLHRRSLFRQRKSIV